MASILMEYVSSRIPVIWVYSIEEDRLLHEEANWMLHKRAAKKLYVYDASNRIYDYEYRGDPEKGQFVEVDSPVEAVQAFLQPSHYEFDKMVVEGQSTWDLGQHGFPNKSILVMLDAPFYMTDPNKVKHTNARLTRAIKNAAPLLVGQSKTIVFVNHHTDIPVELENLVTYVEHKLPTVKTMRSIVKGSQESFSTDSDEKDKDKKPVKKLIPKIQLTQDELDVIAQQLTGLTKWQAENVLALANRQNAIEFLSGEGVHRTFKNDVIRREKARLIQKSGVLQIVDANWGMDEVGGMENLKQWAKDRALVFTHEAREDGIDLPKGLCVVGPGGTGKSWVAQALGKEWDRTVLRLDIGACMGSFLGESEGRLIKALKDSEAQAPCILFVDEQ